MKVPVVSPVTLFTHARGIAAIHSDRFAVVSWLTVCNTRAKLAQQTRDCVHKYVDGQTIRQANKGTGENNQKYNKETNKNNNINEQNLIK
jgi:hypothetical protein